MFLDKFKIIPLTTPITISNLIIIRKEIKYQNGDEYKGETKNDKKHGKGQMIYSNGDIYDGDWMDDQKNGIGKY